MASRQYKDDVIEFKSLASLRAAEIRDTIPDALPPWREEPESGVRSRPVTLEIPPPPRVPSELHLERERPFLPLVNWRAAFAIHFWWYRAADALEAIGIWLGAKLWDLADWMRGNP
jgi:hypothetical protein